jgi:hypothetical protein
VENFHVAATPLELLYDLTYDASGSPAAGDSHLLLADSEHRFRCPPGE